MAGIALGGLRALAETQLPDSAAISRYAETNTASGVSRAYTTVATVACRVQPLGRSSGKTELVGPRGGPQTADAWQISLPAATDVTVKDRLVVSGRTFEVAEVLARSYEVVRVALCREVL